MDQLYSLEYLKVVTIKELCSVTISVALYIGGTITNTFHADFIDITFLQLTHAVDDLLYSSNMRCEFNYGHRIQILQIYFVISKR